MITLNDFQSKLRNNQLSLKKVEYGIKVTSSKILRKINFSIYFNIHQYENIKTLISDFFNTDIIEHYKSVINESSPRNIFIGFVEDEMPELYFEYVIDGKSEIHSINDNLIKKRYLNIENDFSFPEEISKDVKCCWLKEGVTYVLLYDNISKYKQSIIKMCSDITTIDVSKYLIDNVIITNLGWKKGEYLNIYYSK